MPYPSHYGHIFDIPLAKAARGARDVFRGREQADRIGLEFGEMGRDPRFPSGWYVLPVFVVAVVAVVALSTV